MYNGEIINDIKKQNTKVTVLKNSKNLGKGAALMNAQDYITTDFVVIHDADLEYFPKDLKNHELKIIKFGRH